ncbi:MAG: hypothetical protein WCH46_00530 [bacterium]
MATENKSENSIPSRDEFIGKFTFEHPRFFEKPFKNVQRITDDEMDVCAGVHARYSNHDIGLIFGIPERTVEKHRMTVSLKAGLKDGQRLNAFLKIL